MGLGVVITLVSLIGAFALGDYTVKMVQGADESGKWTTATDVIELDGSVGKDSVEDKKVTVEQAKVVSISFTLTFEDEADADSRHTNLPDTLGLEVSSEFGTDGGEATSEAGNSADVTLTFTAPEKKPWDTRGKTWVANITAVSVGDQEPLVPDPLGLRTINDPGNDFSLTVEVVYKIKA